MKRRNKNKQTTTKTIANKTVLSVVRCLAVFQSIIIIHAAATAIKKITFFAAYGNWQAAKSNNNNDISSQNEEWEKKIERDTQVFFSEDGEKKIKENCNKKYRHDTLWLII